MMENQINRIVKNMIREQMIEETEKENYIYTITCLTESVMVIASILLISFFLDNMIPTIGFLVFFFSLRKRTGGYHAKTFFRCYLGTLLTYGVVALLCERVMLYRQLNGWLLYIAAGLIMIIGTVNHPNIHWNMEEEMEARKAARWMLLLELCILCFLKWIDKDNVAVCYLSTAVILCSILLCVAKMIGQEVKEYGKEE